MSTLARSFKSSPARCAAVPVPGDANEYLPGLARTSARNSFRFLAGSEGCTDNTFGMRHSSDIAEVARRVVRKLCVHPRVHRVRADDQTDGVAVGRRLGDRISADDAARAGLVLDDYRLADG